MSSGKVPVLFHKASNKIPNSNKGSATKANKSSVVMQPRVSCGLPHPEVVDRADDPPRWLLVLLLLSTIAIQSLQKLMAQELPQLGPRLSFDTVPTM